MRPHETSAEAMPGGLATRRRRRGLTAARWPAMAVGAVAVIGLLMIEPATGRAAADGAFRSGSHDAGGAVCGAPAVGALVTIDGPGRLGTHFCSASA